MTDTGSSPVVPGGLREQDIDWRDARERMRRVVRARMASRPDELVEDVTSDGLVRLIRLARARPIEHLQGAIASCGELAVKDFARRWLRKRAREQSLLPGVHDRAEEPGGIRDLADDPLARMGFVVRSILAERQSRCVELLDAYAEHRDWGTVAEQLGRAAAAVRKQWQRCRDVVESAVRSGGATIFEWIFEHEGGTSA